MAQQQTPPRGVQESEPGLYSGILVKNRYRVGNLLGGSEVYLGRVSDSAVEKFVMKFTSRNEALDGLYATLRTSALGRATVKEWVDNSASLQGRDDESAKWERCVIYERVEKLCDPPREGRELLRSVIPLLRALNEVHKANYAHTDIRAKNVLWRSNSGTTEAVLIDFEHSNKINVNDPGAAASAAADDTVRLVDLLSSCEKMDSDPFFRDFRNTFQKRKEFHHPLHLANFIEGLTRRINLQSIVAGLFLLALAAFAAYRFVISPPVPHPSDAGTDTPHHFGDSSLAVDRPLADLGNNTEWQQLPGGGKITRSRRIEQESGVIDENTLCRGGTRLPFASEQLPPLAVNDYELLEGGQQARQWTAIGFSRPAQINLPMENLFYRCIGQ